MKYEDKRIFGTSVKPVTTYHERRIGKTLYRVTSVYKGEIELATALESLIIRKILRSENASQYS